MLHLYAILSVFETNFEHTLAVTEAGCDGSLGKPFYPSTLRSLLYSIFLDEYEGFEGETMNTASRPGH